MSQETVTATDPKLIIMFLAVMVQAGAVFIVRETSSVSVVGRNQRREKKRTTLLVAAADEIEVGERHGGRRVEQANLQVRVNRKNTGQQTMSSKKE